MDFEGDPRVDSKLTSAMIGISSHSSSGVNVSAGDVLDLNIIVSEPSVVFFIFNTPDLADIGFEIDFQPHDEEDKDAWTPMIESQRINALQGEFDVPSAGVCRLTWDNSYSWFRDKTVCYSIYQATVAAIQTERIRLQELHTMQCRVETIHRAGKRAQQLEAELVACEELMKEKQGERDELVETVVSVEKLLQTLQQKVMDIDRGLVNISSRMAEIQSEAQELEAAMPESEKNGDVDEGSGSEKYGCAE